MKKESILFEFKGKIYCVEIDIFNPKNELKRVPKTFTYYPRYLGNYIAIDIGTYSIMALLIDKNSNIVAIEGCFGSGAEMQLEDGRSVLYARFITDKGSLNAYYLDGKIYYAGYVYEKDGKNIRLIPLG